MKVISVCNKKGGVGKTSIAVNFSAALKKIGYEVLLIDLDPQGNAGEHISVILDDDDIGSEQIFLRDELTYDKYDESIADFADTLIRTSETTGIDIIPATDELDNITQLVSKERTDQPYILYKFLKHFDFYDYVIIDCPPSMQLLTQNAIIAADQIFIPIIQDRFSMSGLVKFIDTIKKINHFSESLVKKKSGIIKIIPNKLDNRLKLGKHLLDEIRGHFPGLIVGTAIPTNSSIMNAQITGQSILEFDPKSKAAKALLNLLKELKISKNKKKVKVG